MFRLCLIDDDPLVRASLSAYLTRSGFVVHTANGAREGLALLGREQCDLVITDLQMPDVSGVEGIQAIRLQHAGLPIIAISGATPDEMKVIGDAKADVYLEKPFRPVELHQVINRLLDGRAPAR